jgi:hypothetical protein
MVPSFWLKVDLTPLILLSYSGEEEIEEEGRRPS